MAVNTTQSTVSYTGDGADTTWAVPFLFYESNDLLVTTELAGVTTTHVLNTDYTVTGAGTGSGVVTFTVAPAYGATITITRDTDFTQPIALRPQGTYSTATHERMYDRLTIQNQDIDRRLDVAEATLEDFGTITASGTTEDRTLEDRFADAWNIRDFGAVGDGVTNDTGAIQNALNTAALHATKKTVVIPPGVFMCSSVLMTSTHNYVTVVSTGGVLKLNPDAGANTLAGAWVGLLLQSCVGVSLVNLKFDGNQSAMTSTREHVHCLGIAGATFLTIPSIECKNVQGDGVYINTSTFAAGGAVPGYISIGRLHVHNEANLGRNAISVACGRHISIGTGYSFQVGSVINGVTMPGGICLETSNASDVIEDVTIGWAHIQTVGAAGFCVLGRSISGTDATRDWNIQRVTFRGQVLRTGSSGSGLAASNISRCQDVTVDMRTVYAPGRGSGPSVWWADRVNGRITSHNVTRGLLVGEAGQEARDINIEIQTTNFSESGIRTGAITRGRFVGKCTGGLGASTFAIYLHHGGQPASTQTDVVYKIDAQQTGATSRAFRNDTTSPVVLTRVVCQDCDWSGYSGLTSTFDGTQPQKRNIIGVNFLTAAPTIAVWVTGDIVYNSDPANTEAAGWINVLGGTPGTWLPFGAIGRLEMSVSGALGDANATLTPGTSPRVNRFTTTLTANRTVTLSTTGVQTGDTFYVYRTGTGSDYSLDVGGLCLLSGNTDSWCVVIYNGSAWQLLNKGSFSNELKGCSADRGNADFTLQVGQDASTQRINQALTANRTITLSTTGTKPGDRFRIIRQQPSPGNFKTDVGGIHTMPANARSWCDVQVNNGGGWILGAWGFNEPPGTGNFQALAYYDVDFRIQNAQTFPTDATDYTIDGKTWRTRNRTGASVCELINGTGIRITSSAGGAPSLYARWTNLLPNVDARHGFRVMFWISGTTTGSNFSWNRIGVQDYTATSPPWMSLVTGRRSGNDTGLAQEHWLGFVEGGTVSSSNAISTSNLTHDVYCLQVIAPHYVVCYSGAMVGEYWPTTWTFRGVPNSQTVPTVAWDPVIYFGPYDTNTTMDVRRMRLELL